MAYDFYFDRVRLPVPPSKLDVKINGNNKIITLIDEGEINILKKPGLTEISMSMLLPNVRYPFAKYDDGFKNASFFLGKFEALMTSKKSFQFIVARAFRGSRTAVDFDGEGAVFRMTAGSLYGTNIRVTLENYKITDDAKNGFDVSVDINLKEYRPYKTKGVEIKPPADAEGKAQAAVEPQRESENAPTAQTYTVVGADSLWAIAQKQLGNGNRYTEIYELNKEVIDGGNRGTRNTKYTIYPGQVFRIPQEGS